MPRCLVIMFHHVHDRARVVLPRKLDLTGGVKGLTPAAFEQQLDDVARGLEPVDWSTLRRALDGETPLPDDSFLLTFDDGLADHARVVCPILERRGLHGVFFVSTSTLDGTTLLAAHAVHLLLAALGDERFAAECEATARKLGLGTPFSVQPVSASLNYAYESSARAVLKHRLHFEMPATARDAILDDLFRRHLGDPAEWARTWYMTSDDVRRLEAAGHTIGGHGHKHEPLARLTPTEQEADLSRCWKELTGILGRRERPLSYPFGSLSSETPAIARRAGFTQAFTTESRWVDLAANTSGVDVSDEETTFRLPRVDTIHVARELDVTRRYLEVERCP